MDSDNTEELLEPRRRVGVFTPTQQAERDRRLSGKVRTPAQRRSDSRSEAQRDVDRITYSAEWRRLSGVTQVITALDANAADLHTRMTHSEKVAQVARSISDKLLAGDSNADKDRRRLIADLGGLDVSVCEAAALAHDLGHPPFGHVGEKTLDLVARLPEEGVRGGRSGLGLRDGFEGNAQTIRIVTMGKHKSMSYEGLDLTCATLAAIAKYPWPRVQQKGNDKEHDKEIAANKEYRREWEKFNFYDSEAGLVSDVRRFAGVEDKTQTLEASVMDVADDISYAVHDLEDFLLTGMLNIARVQRDLADYKTALTEGRLPSSENNPFHLATKRLKRDYAYWDEGNPLDAARVVSGFLDDHFAIDRELPKAEALIRQAGSELVGRFINEISILPDPLWISGPHIGLNPQTWHEVQLWKTITKSYVISRPDMALHQRGLQNVLVGLVDLILAWVKDTSDVARLPSRLREEYELARQQQRGEGDANHATGNALRGSPNRAILDYICSLTDHQCIDLFQKLSGTTVLHLGVRSV